MLQVPGASSSSFSPMASPALHSAASIVSMGDEPTFVFGVWDRTGSDGLADGSGNGVPRHTSDV